MDGLRSRDYETGLRDQDQHGEIWNAIDEYSTDEEGEEEDRQGYNET